MLFKESGNTGEQKKPATFAELEKKQRVSAAELINTLKDYAEGGWAISDRVVLSLIRRTKLTGGERAAIKNLLQKGVDLQFAHQDTRSATEYQNVLDQMDNELPQQLNEEETKKYQQYIKSAGPHSKLGKFYRQVLSEKGAPEADESEKKRF